MSATGTDVDQTEAVSCIGLMQVDAPRYAGWRGMARHTNMWLYRNQLACLYLRNSHRYPRHPSIGVCIVRQRSEIFATCEVSFEGVGALLSALRGIRTSATSETDPGVLGTLSSLLQLDQDANPLRHCRALAAINGMPGLTMMHRHSEELQHSK